MDWTLPQSHSGLVMNPHFLINESPFVLPTPALALFWLVHCFFRGLFLWINPLGNLPRSDNASWVVWKSSV